MRFTFFASIIAYALSRKPVCDLTPPPPHARLSSPFFSFLAILTLCSGSEEAIGFHGVGISFILTDFRELNVKLTMNKKKRTASVSHLFKAGTT